MIRLFEKYASSEDYYHIMKLFSEFDFGESKSDFLFRYVMEDEGLVRLREKFDYSACMVPGKEFRSMVQLMIWVFEHLIGDGMCIPPPVLNAEEILRATKEQGMKSNCFMHAVVCNEVFLSMGFPSRMVRCMPMDITYNDCHCVTEAYCQEYDKWIVFDAANRSYYLGRDMIPLNLFEIRENLLEQKPLYVPMMPRNQAGRLFEYLMKNLIRFESNQISRYNEENSTGKRTILHFQSRNFPIKDKTVDFPEQKMSIFHMHTSNPNLFWARPCGEGIVL